MCLGTIIANLLVFFVIEYIGAGFAIVCSYFGPKEYNEVGYLYQKTLGLTFLVCVLMTPMVYLSDKFLYLLGFGTFFYILDRGLVQNACGYAWSLVPAFYLYSFIDTNKNYLQSQDVIFRPIIIHFLAVLGHLSACIYYNTEG